MSKPLVYIASPYTKGIPGFNAYFQCRIFDQMMTDGIVWPVAPLLSHFQHTMFPQPYEAWIEYDLVILDRCDALIRLAAEMPSEGYYQWESEGADNESNVMSESGRPVFGSLADCYEWANNKGVKA